MLKAVGSYVELLEEVEVEAMRFLEIQSNQRADTFGNALGRLRVWRKAQSDKHT